MGFVLITFIRMYQKTISPDHGVVRFFLPPTIGCRFSPTCSDFAVSVIREYGISKGIRYAMKRLLSCHPFARSS